MVQEYENRVLKEQIDSQRTTRWELVKTRERLVGNGPTAQPERCRMAWPLCDRMKSAGMTSQDREVASKERTFEKMRRTVKVLEGQKVRLFLFQNLRP